jgi:hypothetical protein
VIDDNLGTALKEGPSGAMRRLAPANRATVVDADFLTHGTPSLMGAGIGYGAYNSIAGVGTTANFATGTVNTVFNHFFGSYFGDWDNSDNVLRATIAAQGVSLASVWSSRPVYNFHPMTMGKTVGECVLATMNQASDSYLQTGFNGRGVHTALMGDPTLRLHIVKSAANPVATITGSNADINWTASATAVDGYHVFRSPAAGQPFVRVTSAPVTGLSYQDNAATSTARYRVCAARKESASGTYWNLSMAADAQLVAGALSPLASWKNSTFGSNAQNPAVSGDFSDPDKDGVCNLMEYATGTNPNDAKSKSSMTNVCIVGTGANRKLCGDFTICTKSTDVAVKFQCTSDLKTWTDAPAPTVVATNGDYQTLRVSLNTQAPKCFFRALITQK